MGGGHNDLLMLMLVLAGVLLVLRSREALGGAAVLAAVAVKATAGVALPFLVCLLWILAVSVRLGIQRTPKATAQAAPYAISVPV